MMFSEAKHHFPFFLISGFNTFRYCVYFYFCRFNYSKECITTSCIWIIY